MLSGKLLAWTALGGCLLAATSFGTTRSNASARRSIAAHCVDYEILDVHGSSSEADTGTAMAATFKENLEMLWPNTRIEIETAPFKAAGGVLTLVGGKLRLPAGYHTSVVRTKDWLRGQLNIFASWCPRSRLILSGYSQGAQVAADVFQERIWPQVVGVVLYGDPYYNHADSSDQFGLNVELKHRAMNRKNGGLADLGPRKPFNSPEVVSFCHQNDPVCQAVSLLTGVLHRSREHKNYSQFDEPQRAASYFAAQLGGDSNQQYPQYWPTNRHDGLELLYNYTEKQRIWMEWSSCDPQFLYCLVEGTTEDVHVLQLSRGVVKAEKAMLSVYDFYHRKSLRKIGLSEQEISWLLGL